MPQSMEFRTRTVTHWKYIRGQLPDNLTPGVYKLFVKTQSGANGQMLNDVRTGKADFGLTVK